jgi:hypothetical protein
MVMPSSIIRLMWMLLLVAFIEAGPAQAQVNCFVQTQMDRRDVYAQQPFKITFTVLTATYYTAPLEFDNIQIPNAFVIPFDRTQSGMFPSGGKQYPGLQFYFIVFPYVPGKFTIPPIKIVATTPAVGDYKAQKVTLTTPAQDFVVKAVPAAFKGGTWFVAKDVHISEDWNRKLKDLKVGDIVEQTISIDARGTLPQFIPVPDKDSLDWAGVYAKTPILEDTRDQYDANGRLTRTFTYLLEKEGAYTFPAQEVKWWNPYSNHVYTRSSAPVRVQVGANPNLGMLATLKDSLNIQQPVQAVKPEKKAGLLILGLPWYWFCLYALVTLGVLFLLLKWAVRLFQVLRASRQTYLASEAHWFRKFMRSPDSIEPLLLHLYQWWDRWPARNKRASVSATLKEHDADDVDQELGLYLKSIYGAGATSPPTPAFKRQMRAFRDALSMKGSKSAPMAKELVSPDQQEWA